MMNKVQKRWIAVSVIWSLVLTCTVWNISRVSKIQQRRHELETAKMDLRFLAIHAANINRVQGQERQLTHHVKSFGLGFLVVENDLKRLSDICGLVKIRIETKKDPQESRRAPIHITGTGTVSTLMRWLASAEEAYPYLTVTRLEMSHDHRKNTAQLQATFTYHYSLAPLGKEDRI